MKEFIFLFLIPFSIFAQNTTEQRSYIGLETGGRYNILQYRANIREEPRINSNVIAILSLNDEIEILENTWVKENINNVWGYWYKVKYGRITGYTFGGNIARQVLITDIDKNGTNDYFYYRAASNEEWVKQVSSSWRDYYFGYNTLKKANDIIIYINNQLIDTTMLISTTFHHPFDRLYDWCEFEEYEAHVLINLIDFGRQKQDGFIWKTAYRIDGDGTIALFEKTISLDSQIWKKFDKHGKEWWPLRIYEDPESRSDYREIERIIDTNNQTWVRVEHSGK